jgi:PAS domain S-box-containing protein
VLDEGMVPRLGDPAMPERAPVQERRLEVGERLLLLSDGILGRPTVDGGTLGVDGVHQAALKAHIDDRARDPSRDRGRRARIGRRRARRRRDAGGLRARRILEVRGALIGPHRISGVWETSEHELRAALAGAPVGVGLWDAELRYRWVNDTLAEINGVPAEAHVGRTLGEVLPEMPREVIETYRRVLETGSRSTARWSRARRPRRPGRLRSWAVSVFPIPGRDGEPGGIASIIEDVTALEDARAEASSLEAELALERLLLAEVVERVPLGSDAAVWGRELRYR